eukprot:1137094-Pelagomonas_calceolata.AAC.4
MTARKHYRQWRSTAEARQGSHEEKLNMAPGYKLVDSHQLMRRPYSLGRTKLQRKNTTAPTLFLAALAPQARPRCTAAYCWWWSQPRLHGTASPRGIGAVPAVGNRRA